MLHSDLANERDARDTMEDNIRFGFQCPVNGVSIEAEWHAGSEGLDSNVLTLYVNRSPEDTDEDLIAAEAWCRKIRGSFPDFATARHKVIRHGCDSDDI